MKMQICGIEITEGVSKKTGKAYSMGRLHTLIQLAPAHGEGNVAKGLVGSTYECDANLLRKVEHLPFPVSAEVDVQPMQRFGERAEIVVDIRPLEVIKKAA
jgi:hypothetical protein